MNNARLIPPTLLGRHVLAIMVTFFLVVTAVDVILIVKAVSTFSGNDTDDAYRKGVAYNQTISEEATQDKLGWTDITAFDHSTGKLTVLFRNQDGAAIDGLHVSAQLGRPASNAFDQNVVLQPLGNGVYAADLAKIPEGAWTVSLSAGADSSQKIMYRSRSRLWKQP